MRITRRSIAAGLTGASTAIALVCFRSLPARVPIHFTGWALQADAVGPRRVVLLLAGVGLFLHAFLEGRRQVAEDSVAARRAQDAALAWQFELPASWHASEGQVRADVGRDRRQTLWGDMQVAVALTILSSVLLVVSSALAWWRLPAVALVYGSLFLLVATLGRALVQRQQSDGVKRR